nr:YidC/Oxa1 family membrane protein insertase [Microbacterium flavescens]
MQLAALLEPLAGGAAAAASVLLVTLLVRAALVPAGVSQARAEQTRSRLAPKLRELQKRYGRDRERLQRETMKLYADENTSPFAGCLPLLAQAPVIAIVYALFAYPAIAGHANALLTETLLGVPLGASVVGSLAAGTATAATFAVFGVLIVVIVIAAEITRRAFRPPVMERADASPLAGAGVARAVGVLQFTTAVIALFVPLAAAIYLATTVVWTLVQRIILRRRFPLAVP